MMNNEESNNIPRRNPLEEIRDLFRRAALMFEREQEYEDEDDLHSGECSVDEEQQG